MIVECHILFCLIFNKYCYQKNSRVYYGVEPAGAALIPAACAILAHS